MATSGQKTSSRPLPRPRQAILSTGQAPPLPARWRRQRKLVLAYVVRLCFVLDNEHTANRARYDLQMSWSSAPIPLLDAYRTAHNLPTPTAFTTPRRQALLTNPGIGRQSPTMAQKKDKRRVSKDQLALAVRKHFNSAAVNEIDVVVEVIYRVKNQSKWISIRIKPVGNFTVDTFAEKAFRMRPAPPSGPKKA